MKIKNLVLLLASFVFLLNGKVFAQDEEAQAKQFAMAVGIDIGNLYSYDYFTPMATLNLDFDLMNAIRIEPEFGFSTSKGYDSNDQLESQYKTIKYGSGFYGLVHFGNATTYFGLKFDKTTNQVERETSGDPYKYKLKQSSVGPAFGLEYKFGRRFSIGAEFDILYAKSHREESDMPNDEINLIKGWETGTSLKFRFYIL